MVIAERSSQEMEGKRYLSAKELKQYSGLGSTRARQLGVDAGARIKYGNRVVYDVQKIDEYLASIRQ